MMIVRHRNEHRARGSVPLAPLGAALTATLLLLGAGTPSALANPEGAPSPTRAAAGHPAGEGHGPGHQHGSLPDDGPPALYRAVPSLPHAPGWPARDDAFPLTSGTGRLADGAAYWTDYLYDDHGATTASTGDPSVTAGSPSFGTYRYPDGAQYADNAADIFRAAVALRAHDTVWRVDFTTLQRATVPIAEWTFDRDDDPATGASAWPDGAGVSSPGIDTGLVVSAGGARLLDVVSGATLATLPVQLSTRAGSIVVTVPRSVLPVSGSWRIRLAAGLADPAGTGFARPPGTTPLQTAVYNVAFRTRAQETPSNNFWNDQAQTAALDTGSVADFAAVVDWARLAARDTTPQPTPPGWNDRWYVSAVDLGPGVVVDPATISDGAPNYLGRVQPYAVYVPAHRTPGRRMPLTFLLHSLTQNHNQYAATTPNLVAGACERRRSVCVTTLGRGPDGNYFDYAELDLWQVWHAVAQSFRLAPDRTVVSGYSMGGIGSNQLATAHPDLFARSVTLAGGLGDAPALANLRWVPTYLAGGSEDELVPVTVQRAEAEALRRRGLRYRWLVVAGLDHVAYELCDCFDDAVAFMGHARRVVRPDRFSFRWTPTSHQTTFAERFGGAGGLSWTQHRAIGVGTTGAYWVRDLAARSATKDAEVVARSGLLPQRSITATPHTGALPASPTPTVVQSQTWRVHRTAPTGRTIALRLTNVSRLRLLAPLAGLRSGHTAVVRVSTDGVTRLDVGSRHLTLTAGTHRIPIRR